MADADLYPTPELLDYVSGLTDVGVSRAVGKTFRDAFVDQGGLRPTDRVLDVGCGTGRIALALTDDLAGGRYDGFDISRAAIDWCQNNITTRHPNFRFRHADVFNAFYNPSGRHRARRFRFPYPSGAFDFVFLTSVFTHMLPRDLTHYLTEISRVLRPGGRCLTTFFLHTAETATHIRAGRSAFRLPLRYGRPLRPVGADPEYGDCLTETLTEPERVVAYEEKWVLDRFAASGLTVDERPQQGTWSGRPGSRFQDVILATKTGSVSLSLRAARVLRTEGLREVVWRMRTKPAVPRAA